MTLSRPFGIVALAVALAGLIPATTAASCVQATVAERAALAEVVVYGTVTETRQTFAPAGGVIRFRPEHFLKGTLPGEVQVYLGPTKGAAITSVDYEAVTRGQGHTLYLRPAGDGNWQTDGCSGSHAGQPSTAEIALLGAGTVAPPTTPADNTAVVVGAIVLVVLAVLAFVIVLRQSRGRSTLKTTSP